MKRTRLKADAPDALTDAETRDIRLWFGWGVILDYPTSPVDYLHGGELDSREVRRIEDVNGAVAELAAECVFAEGDMIVIEGGES